MVRDAELGRRLADKLVLAEVAFKDYIAAYIALHSKARLGVAEDKSKSAWRKDERLHALRTLAGIALMPVGQLRVFDDKLDRLKSRAALVEPELTGSPSCARTAASAPRRSRVICFRRPTSRSKQMDDELDRTLEA